MLVWIASLAERGGVMPPFFCALFYLHLQETKANPHRDACVEPDLGRAVTLCGPCKLRQVHGLGEVIAVHNARPCQCPIIEAVVTLIGRSLMGLGLQKHAVSCLNGQLPLQ
jgi:hypothetical protein